MDSFKRLFLSSAVLDTLSVFEVRFQEGFGVAFNDNESNWIATWFDPTTQFSFGFRNAVPSKQAIAFFEQIVVDDDTCTIKGYARSTDYSLRN